MESIKYLKKNDAKRRFFISSQSLCGENPRYSHNLFLQNPRNSHNLWGNGVILARGGVIWGVEIWGEMGGGECRFLGKSIDKGLQML